MIYKQYLVTGEDLDQWDCIYRMGDIALSLNILTPELAKTLPPTDSRFRTDMQHFEKGENE